MLKNAKRFLNNYIASNRFFHLKNKNSIKMNVIFQVADDGVPFRYHFPEKDTQLKKINSENTSFHFLESTKPWMQPISLAKTG